MIRVFKTSPVPIREYAQGGKGKIHVSLTLNAGEAEFSGMERDEKN
jgi:hypothetical protein